MFSILSLCPQEVLECVSFEEGKPNQMIDVSCCTFPPFPLAEKLEGRGKCWKNVFSQFFSILLPYNSGGIWRAMKLKFEPKRFKEKNPFQIYLIYVFLSLANKVLKFLPSCFPPINKNDWTENISQSFLFCNFFFFALFLSLGVSSFTRNKV